MGEPDIDLYADDLDNGFNSDFNNDDNEDLYDDVISAPSDDHNADGRSVSRDRSSPHRHDRPGGIKRATAYIGNLTWWTTDQDIVEAVKNLGVLDVMEVKFFENRANGQSKGFCVVNFGSEGSLRTVMDKLPKKDLHGQNPVVTQYTQHNLNYFEMQSQKGQGGRSHERDGGGGGGGGGPGPNDRGRMRNYDRDREPSRGMSQERMRSRNQPPQHYMPPPQRGPPGPHMQHPPPQGPPPAQYPPDRAPWMTAPPPQIHQMPPPVGSRPGGPPTNVPPPPGLHGLPPPRPGVPPPANIHVPPPSAGRGPPPPMNIRHVPPPDTRGPPPPHDWDRPNMSQPPPQVGPPNRPPPPLGQGLPPAIPPPAPHAPSPHINPAFFQHQGVPPGLVATSAPSDMYSRPPPSQIPEYRPSGDRQESSTPTMSESEFEDIMGRNRSVSSSAIARAVSDASTGDYACAIETLVTAISLIKQSKVANDERCKILISSLQDTLHGIESKSYGSRIKERARSRERERSRERSSRREKSSRRDRSRSRDREYRDRSRERDRYHEDRYRDKDRDHDRRSSRR